jgi:c-di-GMP-binding flagellar brake protein YcgR
LAKVKFSLEGAYKVGDKFTLFVNDDRDDVNYPSKVEEHDKNGDLLVAIPLKNNGAAVKHLKNTAIECTSFTSFGRYLLSADIVGYEWDKTKNLERMRIRPTKNVDHIQLRESYRISARRFCEITMPIYDIVLGVDSALTEEVYTNDISTGGVQLITSQEYQIGSQLRLALNLEYPEKDHPPLGLVGEVRTCRVRDEVNSRYLVGVQFLTVAGKPIPQESTESQIIFRFIRSEELQRVR